MSLDNQNEETRETIEEVDGSDTVLDLDTSNNNNYRMQSRAHDVFEFIEMLLLAACLILFLFSFVARISVVDGESMHTLLEDGDRLLVSDLFYTPSRGDIVIFENTTGSGDDVIIKRVIGLPGETIVLTYRNEGNITTVTTEIDGVVLDESAYRYYDTSMSSLYRNRYTGTYTYVVPEGEYFLMGDNTYNSEDSRGHFGFVKRENILGRLILRLSGDDLSDFGEKFGQVN